jgi:hypothetical protein
MDIITSQRTYSSRANAVKRLEKVFGDKLDKARWLIAVKEDGRFVPTVLGHNEVWAAHHGIMVIA